MGTMSLMVPSLLFLSRPPSLAVFIIFIFLFVSLIVLDKDYFSFPHLSVSWGKYRVRSYYFSSLPQHGRRWDMHSRTNIVGMFLSICWALHFPLSFLPSKYFLPFPECFWRSRSRIVLSSLESYCGTYYYCLLYPILLYFW